MFRMCIILDIYLSRRHLQTKPNSIKLCCHFKMEHMPLLLESIMPNKTQRLGSNDGSQKIANKENNKNNLTLIMVNWVGKRGSAIPSVLYEVLPEQTSFVPSTLYIKKLKAAHIFFDLVVFIARRKGCHSIRWSKCFCLQPYIHCCTNWTVVWMLANLNIIKRADD